MRFFWKYKLDHLVFWCVTISFYASVTAHLISTAGLFQYCLNIVVRNGLLMLICYSNVYYCFPQYFKRGKYALYALSVVSCLLFYTIFQNIYDTWLYGYVLGDLQKQSLFYNTFYNFSIALFYLSFTLALALSKNWYKQQQLLQKIQVEQLETELQYLKAQINPHFLFNSINTIYFQIDKKNMEARESLQKFSELLRYQLYECNEQEIAIEKEIEYLKSYIDLQRLRRKKNYNIQFETGADVQHFSIAPLLLIAFVENAFKHVSNYADKDNTIQVQLHQQNGYMLFHVINTKSNNYVAHDGDGIGLKNVQRRLKLLYENRYDLQIENEPDFYAVHLKLQTS
ncbi:sensor histidine kinase [Ilyomonas limi]|nr:histidine kinase [Ilyomonas limi]